MCEKTSQKYPPATDLTRWRLKVHDGSQVWHYLESDAELAAWPQSKADKYFIGLPCVSFFSA